jgi:hypothetical protein
MLVFSKDPVPWSFPEDTEEIKTIWWLRPMTDKQWAILQAQMERQKRMATEVGRDRDDADATGRGKDLEYRVMSGQVDRIDNYGAEGTVTTVERIAEIMATMSYACYQQLGGKILSMATLGVLEGN